MEGISFGQLCDEFECISSPAVERTARQLVKDIMDIKEGQRSLSNFGVDVEYKVRSITAHLTCSNQLSKIKHCSFQDDRDFCNIPACFSSQF